VCSQGASRVAVAALPLPRWSASLAAGQWPSLTVCRLRQAGQGGPPNQAAPSTRLHSFSPRCDPSLDSLRPRMRFAVPPVVTHDAMAVRVIVATEIDVRGFLTSRMKCAILYATKRPCGLSPGARPPPEAECRWAEYSTARFSRSPTKA